MNHYIETTILDLGAFHNSAITVKKGTYQICCGCCPFLGRIGQKREGSEPSHSLVQALYSKLQPRAPFYGQIKNL